MCSDRSWDTHFAARSLALALFDDVLAPLSSQRWPTRGELQHLLEQRAVRNACGLPLRLVEAPNRDERELSYEQRLFGNGELEQRADNWHDLFNVAAWLAFPSSKAALNARHCTAPLAASGERGPLRDALTLFDEDGLIVVSSSDKLVELACSFRWKDLFWEQRVALLSHMRFIVFGHALAEKLLDPFVGITGRALFVQHPAPHDATIDEIDSAIARRLQSSRLARPRDLQPVPALGIPGWYAQADESFFDNTHYFRSGRRQAA